MQETRPAAVLHPEADTNVQNLRENESAEPAGRNAPAQQTDEQLMVAFARGRADAFNLLFDRYKGPLFGFFRRRLDDAAQAEELAQETFLAILRGAVHYEATALFRTWLYAIAFRILRAQRRKAAFRAMFAGSVAAHDEPAARDDLHAELVLRDAVRKLDRMDREILLLREFEQLSYAEIAMLLGIPVNTVRSRLFRARMELRALLMAPAPVAAAPENPQLTRSEGRA